MCNRLFHCYPKSQSLGVFASAVDFTCSAIEVSPLIWFSASLEDVLIAPEVQMATRLYTFKSSDAMCTLCHQVY